MILKEIKMKDFLSHKDTSIKIGPRITALIGENGAGKSSILDAIYYSFFKDINRGLKIDDLIRKGENASEVSLSFQVENKTYSISRKRRRDGSTRSKLFDITDETTPKTLTTSTKIADQLIVDIIGLNKELFKNAIYIQQGEIADLVTKTSSERKKIIGRLLSLDKYELAYTEMFKVITHFEQSFARIIGELKQVPKLKEKLKEEKGRVSGTEKDINSIIEQEKLSKNEYEEKKTLKEVWDAKKSSFVENNTELNAKNRELTTEEKSRISIENDLTEINNAEERLKEIKPELSIFDDIKRAKELLDKISSESLLLESITEKFNQILDWEATIDQNKSSIKEYNDYKKEIKAIDAEIKPLKETNDIYQQLTGKKKGLIKSKSENQKIVNRIFANMRKIDLEVKETNDENIKILKEYRKSVSKECQTTQKAMDKLNTEIGKENGIISETYDLINTLETAKNICPVCNSKLTKEHKEKVLLEQETKIKKSSEEEKKLLKQKEKETKLLERNQKKLRFLDENADYKKLRKTDKDLESNRIDFDLLVSDMDKIKKQVESYQELIKLKTEHREKLESLQENYDEYKLAEKALKKIDKSSVLMEKTGKEELIKDLKEESSNILTKTNVDEGELEERIVVLRDLDEERIKLETKISRKENVLKMKEDNKKKINELDGEVSTLEKELENIGYSEEDYKTKSYEFTVAQKKYQEIRKNLAKKKTLQREIKRSIKELEKDIRELEKKDMESKRLEKYIQFLKKIRKVFHKDGIQENIRQEIKPIIKYHTQDLFHQFNLPFTGLELTDDYNIQLQKNDADYYVSEISGGEKTASALALRLGIAKALAGKELQLIMLDEPTIHLDSQRRTELVNIILQLRSIPQIIVVSHDDELKKAADTTLEVEMKNGISEVSPLQID